MTRVSIPLEYLLVDQYVPTIQRVEITVKHASYCPQSKRSFYFVSLMLKTYKKCIDDGTQQERNTFRLNYAENYQLPAL